LPDFSYIAFTLFFLILFAGIYLTFFDLLGTVIIFLDVFFYAFVTGFEKIDGKIIVSLLLIVLFIEAINLFWVTKGAYRPVTTKKTYGITFSGALLGIFILTPLWGGPGVWGGFFLGGFVAMMAMELARQRRLRAYRRVSGRALFAFGARKMIKGVAALVMIAVSLTNIYS